MVVALTLKKPQVTEIVGKVQSLVQEMFICITGNVHLYKKTVACTWSLA